MRSRIYVTLQKEYLPYFPEMSKYFNKPLILNKTLYGLTVSAKYWNNELMGCLYNNIFGNFKISTADQRLFAYVNVTTWLKFIFYVDNVIYYGDSKEADKHFFDEMSKQLTLNPKVRHTGFL